MACPHRFHQLKTPGPSDEGSSSQIQSTKSLLSRPQNTLPRDTWKQKVYPSPKGDHTNIWTTALWRFPNWTHHTMLAESHANYLRNHHMCSPCPYFSLDIYFRSLCELLSKVKFIWESGQLVIPLMQAPQHDSRDGEHHSLST